MMQSQVRQAELPEASLYESNHFRTAPALASKAVGQESNRPRQSMNARTDCIYKGSGERERTEILLNT